MSYVAISISEKRTISIFGAELSGVMILLDMRTVHGYTKQCMEERSYQTLGGSVQEF